MVHTTSIVITINYESYWHDLTLFSRVSPSPLVWGTWGSRPPVVHSPSEMTGLARAGEASPCTSSWLPSKSFHHPWGWKACSVHSEQISHNHVLYPQGDIFWGAVKMTWWGFMCVCQVWLIHISFPWKVLECSVFFLFPFASQEAEYLVESPGT